MIFSCQNSLTEERVSPAASISLILRSEMFWDFWAQILEWHGIVFVTGTNGSFQKSVEKFVVESVGKAFDHFQVLGFERPDVRVAD